ncbi:MAG: hypothetical protein IPM56_00405 [Ignavibacteriales bacterium]|nr:MAG: hypothetical protein IPM56_00405 [Ignavibacteriales bacterium]
MKYIKIILILFILVIVSSCSGLKLSPAEFSWPIESVLKVGSDGSVKEERYSISFNTKPMFIKETEDSTSFMGKSIHLIRNFEGHYFITSAGFKHVYVFNMTEGALVNRSRIKISEENMKNPVFNQRNPFIELVDDGKTFNLTSEGIDGGEE